MEGVGGLKGKKILITGGAGFIGSHLVLELIKNQADVSVIDIKVKPRSFFALNKLSDKASLDILDIRDRKKVFNYFDKFSFDYVFHLAAEPIVEEGYKNPYSTFETNIMGTVHILEASREFTSVKVIIVASSDKAYGKTTKVYTEESPLQGDHPYDVSKSAADLIAQTYFKTYKLPVIITRFGNVYGEGDIHMERIIPGICEAIIKNETLIIRSDGTYVRDYIYVKDVVNGYLFLLKNMDKIIGQAYNFSSKDTLSVIDLVKKVETILHRRIPYRILNNARNEIPYQHLDDGKVKKLGWKSMYFLEKTIPQIIEWYQKNLL